MSKTRGYFDYNASAPLRPVAREALLEASSVLGNPSSVHGFGRTARRVLEASRSTVKQAVGAEEHLLIFTSGGTEANNLALRGFKACPLYLCSTSHVSVLYAREDGHLLAVDSLGLLDLENLDRCLAEGTQGEGTPGASQVLVSVTYANNETGVIQPLPDIVKIAKRYGALVHCDAAQALGRLSLDFASSGLDLLSFSSHKVGGPVGVGALVVRQGLDPHPLITGGGQEYGKRAGSSSLSAASGFAAALQEACAEDWQTTQERLKNLESSLSALGGEIVAKEAPRLPNTCSVRMPQVLAETQLMALDLAGFAVSAGSACSSGKVGSSHVLQAMGYSDQEAREAIRISLCPTTTEEEIEEFGTVWQQLAKTANGRGKGPPHGEKQQRQTL